MTFQVASQAGVDRIAPSASKEVTAWDQYNKTFML